MPLPPSRPFTSYHRAIVISIIVFTLACVALVIVEAVVRKSRKDGFEKKIVTIGLVSHVNFGLRTHARETRESLASSYLHGFGTDVSKEILAGLAIHEVPPADRLGNLNGIEFYAYHSQIQFGVLADGGIFHGDYAGQVKFLQDQRLERTIPVMPWGEIEP